MLKSTVAKPQLRKDLLTPVALVLQVMVAQKVAVGVYKGVTTSELDELAAETSASMTATHPDYALVWCLPLPQQWHDWSIPQQVDPCFHYVCLA